MAGRLDANKVELFKFLAQHIVRMTTDQDKQVITTSHQNAFYTHAPDTSRLAPCNHMEADTRIILHIADAVYEGNSKIMIRTVDTGVVCLAVV